MTVVTPTQVRERPILMSAPMVNGLLRPVRPKTQTRRLLKLPKWSTGDWNDFEVDQHGKPVVIATVSGCQAEIPCPYGKVGDLLWIKETFWTEEFTGTFMDTQGRNDNWVKDEALSRMKHRFIAYREIWGDKRPEECKKWTPSIFMPRWASRITLELTEVRVEKLQDISREDAIAEGIQVLPLQSADDPSAWWQSAPGVHQERTPQASYAALWDSINGKKHPWKSSPWVWVLVFRRVEGDRGGA